MPMGVRKPVGSAGAWHDARMDCRLQPAAPIGPSPLTPCPFLGPPASVGGVAPRPLTGGLPLPAWPTVASLGVQRGGSHARTGPGGPRRRGGPILMQFMHFSAILLCWRFWRPC